MSLFSGFFCDLFFSLNTLNLYITSFTLKSNLFQLALHLSAKLLPSYKALMAASEDIYQAFFSAALQLATSLSAEFFFYL